MKVYEIRDAFGLENLQSGERPTAEPGPGQVRLQMRAVSLNYRDLMMARGHYNPKQPLPLIPCSDGVGIVDAVGEGVERVKVGERVATMFTQTWLGGAPDHMKLRGTLGSPLDGTLCEQMLLSAEGVSPVPEHLSDSEAATLPCAALTAWSALATLGEVGAGDTVLVQGTGGVSIFALQFAQILGARVIVTSSSDAKLERAKELGAWQTINYLETPEWGRAARQMTDGLGVDHIVEVGGAETLAQSLGAARIGGHISVIGVLSGVTSKLAIVSVLMSNLRLQGILVGSREGFEAMYRAISAHRLQPVVDRVFPFAETPAAFEYLASAKHFGKITIEL